MHYLRDPDELTDEEWARLYQDYEYYKHLQYEIYKKALAEALNEAFSNNE